MSSTQYNEELEKNNEDEDDQRSNWKTLPIHLLEKILLHLLDGHCDDDVHRFRLTCESWQSVTLPGYLMPIPKIIKSSEQLLPQLQSSSSSSPQIPWLMFFGQRKGHGILKFCHPITNKAYVMEIPELVGAVFRFSMNDWLLMSRGAHSFFFFNPFTMSTTKLLDVDSVFEIFSTCFTAPPTSHDCDVFAHGSLSYGDIELHLYRDKEWFTDFIREDKETTPAPFMGLLCTPVLCKGNIYSLGKKGMLGIYKPDEEPLWEVLRETELPNISHSGQYLAECDRELVLVFTKDSGEKVYVYRFDWSKSRWQELDSLGSKTMFVSASRSVLVEAKGKGTENRIYFPRFRSMDGSEFRDRHRDIQDHQIQRTRGFVFYSLQTRKYHCYRSNFSCEDWTGTGGVHDHCTWINVPT